MSTREFAGNEPLLTRAQVAKVFDVNPRTITRWARAGRLTSIRTLGGHRRFYESQVHALLGQEAQPSTST